MSMIKQSVLTVEDIMRSDLGVVVLSYEIGQVSPVKMQMLFSKEQLQMLAFVRREEAPKRWQKVLEPADPCWSWGRVPGILALTLLRGTDPSGLRRFTCFQVGQGCLQLVEPLEHERLVLGDVRIGPAHLWTIKANGGHVGRRLEFDRATLEVCEHLQKQQNGKLIPITICTTLLFPTETAADHACWLLAHLGLTVGKVNSIRPL